MEGKVSALLTDSHETQTERVSSVMNAASSDPISFSKTERAAIKAGAGEVSQACKVAFTYGLETNPSIAATFLAKLTLKSRHSHIPLHSSNLKQAKNLISQKNLSDAFTGMPKKSAAHRDG